MRPRFGQLAQLVEQRIENPRVRGSIPRLATNKNKHLAQPKAGLFAFSDTVSDSAIGDRLRCTAFACG